MLSRILVLLSATATTSRPAAGQTKSLADREWAWVYLKQFGYIPSKKSYSNKGRVLTEAIADFQSFTGLNVTWDLDDETLELMHKRRCGNKDVDKKDRAKRFILQGSRWRTHKLTYKISQYPSRRLLSEQEVNEAMEEAFKVWSDVADLEFERVTDQEAHIVIEFSAGNHGDDDPFDGRGGTLAHAFFPVFGGDVHFDRDERWTVKSFKGVSLVQSAAHEIGHSLGLRHSTERSALMAPFYRGYEETVKLDIDDIRGIQEMYGPKKNKNKPDPDQSRSPILIVPKSAPVPPRDNVKPKSDNPICKSRHFDVILTDKEGKTFVFKGDMYWKLTDSKMDPGYPRFISDDWRGIPNNLDAAFTWTNGQIYFFKGSQYWRASSDGRVARGFPRSIETGFPGVPENIDAAIVWARNDKIYLFKGSRYWKLDPDNPRHPIDKSYPRKISNWDGIPDNLDTAMQHSDGKTYFFKDGSYYKYDDRTLSVQEDKPSYPRDIGKYWFGCSRSSSPLLFPK